MRKNKLLLRCCYGISSKADNDRGHVLYLDYDHKSLHCVLSHLKYIIDEYQLSDVYLIKSTHGFNAVCLDVFTPDVILEIGTNVVSPCDRDFFIHGYNRGYYVLRFDCDKRLHMILFTNHNRRLKSLAHKKFLEWFFRITIKDDDNFNDFTKINIVQYPSVKNGYHLMSKEVPPSYVEMIKNVKK